MRLISVPFRLGAGVVATVDEASDVARAEQLAVLVRTHRGERVLAPLFGVSDPTFSGLDPGEVRLGVDTFGPPVTELHVVERPVSDEVVEAVITFA
jgi:hypothetical protein